LERVPLRHLAQRPVDDLGRLEAIVVAIVEQAQAALGFLAQLIRAQHLGVLAPAQHPGDQLARRGVIVSKTEPLPGALSDFFAARSSPKAPKSRSISQAMRSRTKIFAYRDLPQLPVGALAVVAAIEVLGRREVVLGLGGISNLALDPREAKDAHGLALVGVADQIELAARKTRWKGRPCAFRSRRAPSCNR